MCFNFMVLVLAIILGLIAFAWYMRRKARKTNVQQGDRLP